MPWHGTLSLHMILMASRSEDVPWMLMNLASVMATPPCCKGNQYNFSLNHCPEDGAVNVVVTELSRFPYPFWTVSMRAVELVDVDRMLDFSHVEVPENESARFALPALHLQHHICYQGN